jgi:hypothetical protein
MAKNARQRCRSHVQDWVKHGSRYADRVARLCQLRLGEMRRAACVTSAATQFRLESVKVNSRLSAWFNSRLSELQVSGRGLGPVPIWRIAVATCHPTCPGLVSRWHNARRHRFSLKGGSLAARMDAQGGGATGLDYLKFGLALAVICFRCQPGVIETSESPKRFQQIRGEHRSTAA